MSGAVAQVEVAFREQTAGHNALLLFVHLALGMMEERLRNAFSDLRARQAEVRPPAALQPCSSYPRACCFFFFFFFAFFFAFFCMFKASVTADPYLM